MKSIGILFIVLCIILLSKTTHASTTTHHNAYCAGYAAKMATVYRMKYYYNMQQYFDSKVNAVSYDSDELVSEYTQSGTESVNDKLPISQNLVQSCEGEFKRKV